ncbi:MAG: mannanase [Massilia sp.]|nr:mannanase [Massilia sp.]
MQTSFRYSSSLPYPRASAWSEDASTVVSNTNRHFSRDIRSRAPGWWKPGDDFIGDPPQEEQGLHSVFDSDASTLAIIREHAQRLYALQK